jgi:hypothetical protein
MMAQDNVAVSSAHKTYMRKRKLQTSVAETAGSLLVTAFLKAEIS